jgi:predicted protein tyrosine phosphatase
MINIVAYTRHAHAIQERELSLSFNDINKDNGVDVLRRACDVLRLSHIEFLDMDCDSRINP